MIGSKKSFLVVATLAVLFAATPAMAAYTIDSGTEEDPYIWEGSIGSPEDSVVVNPGVYVESPSIIVNGGGSLTVKGNWSFVGSGWWQLGHTTTGTLNIEAGANYYEANNGPYFGRNGGTAIININGGTASFKGLTPRDNATGYMKQVAGDVTIRGAIKLGTSNVYNQYGEYVISGGTSTMNNVTIGSLDDGEYISNGRLEVVGTGATSITATTMELRDTLAFSFGSAGVTLLEIKNLNLTAHMATIELNLDSDIATGVYSLFSFDNLTGDALDNTVLAGLLNLNYAGSHDVTLGLSGNTVQATVAVPEPATMGLLGMGLVGLLARRRRR